MILKASEAGDCFQFSLFAEGMSTNKLLIVAGQREFLY